MFPAHLLCSPSSSPPSSPAPCVDSSPLQSPSLDPMILDDDHFDGDVTTPRQPPLSYLVDPLAASVKGYWPPPQYERRSSNDPKKGKRVRVEGPTCSTGSGSFKKMKFHYRSNDKPTPSDSIFELEGLDLQRCRHGDTPKFSQAPHSREEQEVLIWEEACASVFNGNGTIDLSNQNLTHIPPKIIEDLGKIYIPPESLERFQAAPMSPHTVSRPFMRAVTAPADLEEQGPYLFQPNGRRMARSNVERVRTFADFSLGLPKGQMALYLTQNQITSLPKELFTLQRLTVLSIRNNRLTHLPPEIKLLTNLHTLNVAHNQLRYLPSEMLEMSLEKLMVHPNPFLEPPATFTPVTGRPISQPVRRLPRVIPLVEVCLRRMMSRAQTKGGETLLAAHYELPLPECFDKALPEHIRAAIDACVPGSFYRLTVEMGTRADRETITGLGHCPSPQHSNNSRGIFVMHAEERMTWETRVAGVEVGGKVAVRWRGCNWDCLKYLEEEEGRNTEATGSESAVRVMEFGPHSVLAFDD